jgi:tRNA threonylcarbamoyl adenosine modification protein YeaZ
MKILALEFSSSERSVAIVQGVGPRSAARSNPVSAHEVASALKGAGQSGCSKIAEVVETGELRANAIGMIDSALREAQCEREQIECLAVGLGPGSYNGIRLAIAVAQGWQLASGEGHVKLLGISSVECIAAQGLEERLVGRVNVVIDAQRGEFYMAGYDLDTKGWNAVEPLRLVGLQELQRRTAAGEQFIGPDVAALLQTGQCVFPRAATLGRLALGRRDFVAGENLQPIYLREVAFVKAPPPRRIE